MQLLPDIENHREKLNQEGIELCASMAVQFCQSLARSAGSLVATSACHDSERIADGDQTGPERNSLTGQSRRVAVAVPTFMMVVDSAYQDLRSLQAAQQQGPF
uniref:Uncharacterized protein n=1 Tax=Thermogemmatispora argillosa TaxID=2045280 RepID=A0A455T777_9CHLR|nr:hypothetical protein KTA_34840 [Thermogemmatispora argillosa]